MQCRNAKREATEKEIASSKRFEVTDRSMELLQHEEDEAQALALHTSQIGEVPILTTREEHVDTECEAYERCLQRTGWNLGK